MYQSQQKGAPKLLMQINRNEEVPRLVSIHDINRKDTKNKLMTQARNIVNHNQKQKKLSIQKINRLQTILEQQRLQNQQLRSSIKDLTNQLQKCKQLNEALIQRIKQVQNSYHNLRSDLQRDHEEDKRKQKNSIFRDVEEYVKMAVERIMLNLKQQKMNVSLQNKLERFMAELMEINSVSVQQLVRKNKIHEARFDTAQSTRDPRIQKLRNSYSPNTLHVPPKEQYASIMQRLTRQGQMSRSYAGIKGSQDSRLRNIYATTPQKRRRIFQ